MRTLLAMAGTALALAGCASTGRDAPASGPDAAVQRGQAFAEQRCAGCHVVGLDEREGASGPRFRELRTRFDAMSLQRRFGEISEHGSGEMPPIQITRSQADDLVAYIESLRD
jgi:mono/diheme cytochrome c family protein